MNSPSRRRAPSRFSTSQRDLPGAPPVQQPGVQHRQRSGAGAVGQRARRDREEAGAARQPGGVLGVGLERAEQGGRARHRAARAGEAGAHRGDVRSQDQAGQGPHRRVGLQPQPAGGVELEVGAGQVVEDLLAGDVHREGPQPRDRPARPDAAARPTSRSSDRVGRGDAAPVARQVQVPGGRAGQHRARLGRAHPPAVGQQQARRGVGVEQRLQPGQPGQRRAVPARCRCGPPVRPVRARARARSDVEQEGLGPQPALEPQPAPGQPARAQAGGRASPGARAASGCGRRPPRRRRGGPRAGRSARPQASRPDSSCSRGPSGRSWASRSPPPNARCRCPSRSPRSGSIRNPVKFSSRRSRRACPYTERRADPAAARRSRRSAGQRRPAPRRCPSPGWRLS